MIGLVGHDLRPLSHLVQAICKTVQSSQYIQTLGPFFVSQALWQGRCAEPVLNRSVIYAAAVRQ